MANSITTNPIILDTFTSEIDLGMLISGDSQQPFFVHYIEWERPTTLGDTAVVVDGMGLEIFNEVCAVPYQSILKPFYGQVIYGLKVPASGVSSGRIVILLK